AYTLISPKEQRKFLAIEKLLGKPVTKAAVPEEFGPVPEFNTSFTPHRSGGNKRVFNKPRHFNNNASDKKSS
ncbi:MAG: ATP-dependent helicase, partial [Ferruginibacter sp.]